MPRVNAPSPKHMVSWPLQQAHAYIDDVHFRIRFGIAIMRAGLTLSPQMHSVFNVHAVFERYILKLCTRVYKLLPHCLRMFFFIVFVSKNE